MIYIYKKIITKKANKKKVLNQIFIPKKKKSIAKEKYPNKDSKESHKILKN